MKLTESLGPSLAKPTIGGREEKALKKEYGARLTEPSAPIELIQPIGLGATMALNGS
jgi:hypothetical protein